MIRPLALLATLPLIACAAPNVALRVTPAPKVASDVVVEDETFRGAGDVALFGRHYRPANQTAKAIVVIHHGLLDHGDRYSVLAERLVREGYGASLLDMRGHAHSAGARVAVDDITEYTRDLEAFVSTVRKRDDAPLFLMGHSLGGLIVALYAEETSRPLAGVILSAPALGIDSPPAEASVVKTLDAIAPGATLFKPDPDDFSSSPAVAEDMKRDPLIHQGGAPIHTAAVLLSGVSRAWEHASSWKHPVLIVHGAADKLTAPAASRDFLGRVTVQDKTLKIYEGFHHDLAHEPGAALVVNDVVAWISAHSGGKPLDAAPSVPTGRLGGDRVASSTSVLLEGGVETAHRDVGARGQLSLRNTFGRFGWYGGLDGRFSTLTATRFEADLFALGFAARLGLASQLGITSGFGIGGLRGTRATRVPIELGLETSVGPFRFILRQGVAIRTTGPTPSERALGPFDDVWSLLGVRIGSDRRYNGDLTAGTGPYVGFTYRRTGGFDAIGVGVGIDLWGAN